MTHGSFSGEPQAQWLTDDAAQDRKMRLLADFWFKDPDKKTWTTPNQYVVDGASIPRAIWTLVGSPYTGDYRRASVVHDKACDDAVGNSALRRAADRMFYHACRAGGCSIMQAILMYIGVRIGALKPHVAVWREAIATTEPGPRLRASAAEKRLEADFRLAGEMVLAKGETDDPAEVERRTDAALSVLAGVSLESL